MKVGSAAQTASGSLIGGRSPWVHLPQGAHSLGALLFGKRPPRLVDSKKHPELRRGLGKLRLMKDQIAEVLGVFSGTFEVELCEGSNASISRDGRISFGVGLLSRHQADDDLLVAVLGHEIGHEPWSWPDKDLSALGPKRLALLYREHEAKADRFSGRVLAELGKSPDALCSFLSRLARFEKHPPMDYYPAAVRVRMVREAFRRRKRAIETAGALNPALMARRRELR